MYDYHRSILLSLVIAVASAGCADASEEDPTEASESELALEERGLTTATWEVQQTSYWCGPAATRMALSAQISPPSQAILARELGTTTAGTDWIGQITAVLNARLGWRRYKTVEMPNDPPTAEQKRRLWNDIVDSIDRNFPVVANIVAPPWNHPPGYPDRTVYHYFTVAGYDAAANKVYILDSANFSGRGRYWLSFDQLATLIPPKGYSAIAERGTTCAGGQGVVIGAIEAKYLALGGCRSFLGTPLSDERAAADGIGRYSLFRSGAIYWKPTTGAHEVHGKIRERWTALGAEAGKLGYPISDEYGVPEGRRSDFERGSLVFHAATGEVTTSP